MFEPRKLIPFSIEFCNAPIAVITEMTEKTPMVIPTMVRPERSLFTPNEPRAMVMISLKRMGQNSKSESRNPNKFEARMSKTLMLRFAHDCAEDVHQLLRLACETFAFLAKRSLEVKQAQPVTTLFGFSPAGFDFHYEIAFSNRFIRFDIIGANGTRRANELLGILYMGNRSRQLLNQPAAVLRKPRGSLF